MRGTLVVAPAAGLTGRDGAAARGGASAGGTAPGRAAARGRPAAERTDGQSQPAFSGKEQRDERDASIRGIGHV